MSPDIKTKDLRPCDNCGGNIIPVFYRLEIELTQLVDANTVGVKLAHHPKSTLYLCDNCATNPGLTLSPLDMFASLLLVNQENTECCTHELTKAQATKYGHPKLTGKIVILELYSKKEIQQRRKSGHPFPDMAKRIYHDGKCLGGDLIYKENSRRGE